MKSIRHDAVAAALAALTLPAAAVDFDFDFYEQGRGAGDYLPTNGNVCTGGDRCSSNVDGGASAAR